MVSGAARPMPRCSWSMRPRACRSRPAAMPTCCTCSASARSWSVNKMDLVGYDQARFQEVSARRSPHYLASIGPRRAVIVPISARDGDNIAKRSHRMPWYDGPTVLSALDGFHGHPGRGAAAAPADPGRLQVRPAAHPGRAASRAASARSATPCCSRPRTRPRGCAPWKPGLTTQRPTGRGRRVGRHHPRRAALRRAR
jgi:hypothetical protein